MAEKILIGLVGITGLVYLINWIRASISNIKLQRISNETIYEYEDVVERMKAELARQRKELKSIGEGRNL